MIEKHVFTSEQKLAYWGYGEWVEEPDECYWEYRGLKCEIKRHAQIENESLAGMGHLCGYVILPKDHPWEEMEYDKINVDVHGGITYSRILEDGLTQIGFDCAHFVDETPFTTEKMLKFMMTQVEKDSEQYFRYRESLERMMDTKSLRLFQTKKTYRNIDFVKAECEKLADQAIEALKEHQSSGSLED